MQRIPHDATKYRNNPVELVNIANRQRIGWSLDPYTKLLIPGNGTNGSTAITDLTGKTVTVAGNTNISTNQSIIGGSSIYFDGSGDYLSLADSDDWNITGNSTLDFWFNTSDQTTADYTFGIIATGTFGGSSGFAIGHYLGSVSVTINSQRYSGSGAVTTGAWNHVAIVWINGVSIKTYFNGILLYSGSYESVDTNTSLIMGCVSPIDTNRYFNGYLSFLRISKGLARWTSNFTPPSKLSDYYQMNNYIGA